MAGSQLLIRKRPNCTNYSQQKWWNSRPFWIINWRKETVNLSYRFIFAWPLKAEAQKANYSAPEETNETWPTGIAAFYFTDQQRTKVERRIEMNYYLDPSADWRTRTTNPVMTAAGTSTGQPIAGRRCYPLRKMKPFRPESPPKLFNKHGHPPDLCRKRENSLKTENNFVNLNFVLNFYNEYSATKLEFFFKIWKM